MRYFICWLRQKSEFVPDISTSMPMKFPVGMDFGRVVCLHLKEVYLCACLSRCINRHLTHIPCLEALWSRKFGFPRNFLCFLAATPSQVNLIFPTELQARECDYKTFPSRQSFKPNPRYWRMDRFHSQCVFVWWIQWMGGFQKVLKPPHNIFPYFLLFFPFFPFFLPFQEWVRKRETIGQKSWVHQSWLGLNSWSQIWTSKTHHSLILKKIKGKQGKKIIKLLLFNGILRQRERGIPKNQISIRGIKYTGR